MPMDFMQATDILLKKTMAVDLARHMGRDESSINQARANPSNPKNRRPPPMGWEVGVCRAAHERIQELRKLIDDCVPHDPVAQGLMAERPSLSSAQAVAIADAVLMVIDRKLA